MKNSKENNQYFTVIPYIGLRDMLIFPFTVRPFLAGRKSSISAIEAALAGNQKIFMVLQKDPTVENPKADDVYKVGVVGKISQSIKLPNGHIKLLVEGIERGIVSDFLLDAENAYAAILKYDDNYEDTPPSELAHNVNRLYEELSRKLVGTENELPALSFPPEDIEPFSFQVSSAIPVKTEVKQKLLEVQSAGERLRLLRKVILAEIDHINLDRKIDREVEKQIEKAQKEYYLHEKMRLIKKELGREDGSSDIDELKAKIESSKMNDAAKEKALAELKRLELMPSVSAEATVSRSFIEWLISLPWDKTTEDSLDIKKAMKILDEDHYGLEKAKERIIEFLAVRQLSKESRSNILCFVGPPGTGKTSVAKSIARSMGRKFVRLSLGGVKDEAEIKGHRRTYIGAFPGQIIQLIKRAGTKNPVFLLDEIDKLGSDFRGDPSSALLEVLDPEQNSEFVDHYIDVPFDLSQVFFITTANVTHSIPAALFDRMEVINFSGYTLVDKVCIAQNHLVPKQLKLHGITKKDVEMTEEALSTIINEYTREAGVRNLEREIASIFRKVAHIVVKDKKHPKIVMDAEKVREFLGTPRYKDTFILNDDEVGVAVGLAWTQNGGEVLLVEARLMPGRSNLELTGQMGDVMRESAKAALSFIRSNSKRLGLSENLFKLQDVHIHIPEGAIPKDGPSAGITMAVALVSAFTKIKVRHIIAMTGELTLRGKVLPVGGIKEKVLAAKLHGINEVILPKDNQRDLDEVQEKLKEGMTFHFVETLEDVFRYSLTEDPFVVRPTPPLDTNQVEQAEKVF
ncbi:MAG: endopeptidase La [Acidobacteriota bacterium]